MRWRERSRSVVSQRLLHEDMSVSLLLVGSANARVGMVDGMAVLRDGGTAVDAVVGTIRRVEANEEDHSVGRGGRPNLLGEVELDASIMDGRTLATGAVGALRGYQDAIDLARDVMDELPHVLLVGAGAERLAAEMEFPPSKLLTPDAERTGDAPRRAIRRRNRPSGRASSSSGCSAATRSCPPTSSALSTSSLATPTATSPAASAPPAGP